MLAANLIVVWQDDDLGAGKVWRQLIRPFARAHGIAGCRCAKGYDGVGAFFAFGNENGLFLRYTFYNLWQSIWDLPNALDAVNVLARAIFVPLDIFFNGLLVLANVAILEPAHFEKLVAVFVDIGPCLDDAKLFVFSLEFDRIF